MYRGGCDGGAASPSFGGYGADDPLALTFADLVLAPASPAGGPAHAQLVPVSPRAAGQAAFNAASAAEAEGGESLLFDAADVRWLQSAYGQAFDPERLLAGDAALAEERQPQSPGYHRRVLASALAAFASSSLGGGGRCARVQRGSARGGARCGACMTACARAAGPWGDSR